MLVLRERRSEVGICHRSSAKGKSEPNTIRDGPGNFFDALSAARPDVIPVPAPPRGQFRRLPNVDLGDRHTSLRMVNLVDISEFDNRKTLPTEWGAADRLRMSAMSERRVSGGADLEGSASSDLVLSSEQLCPDARICRRDFVLLTLGGPSHPGSTSEIPSFGHLLTAHELLVGWMSSRIASIRTSRWNLNF